MKKQHTLAIEQKEDAKHGEAFFPVQKYMTLLSGEHPVVTTHWHEEAELTLITGGCGHYQIDLVDYEVQAGDLVFVPPLVLHAISLGEGVSLSSETYVFHMNFLGGNATDICSTRYLRPMMNQELSLPCLITAGHPAYDELKNSFDRIAALYDEAVPGYELDVAETITVSELAKLCYFSDYHFMRFFKKHMNMTCVEYINNLRLEKAVELFEQGNTSVLDVSLSVGFHNLSYFHRAFKKKYGMTPRSLIERLE